MPEYALLCFHLRSDELKAWRLALRLDPEFARDCLTRMDFLTGAFAEDSDFVDARYSLGDNWPDRVRVLQVQGSPEFFDAELEALDDVAMVELIPSFARDITDPGDHLVYLGVSEHGIWIDYVEDLSGATHSAEFLSREELETIVRTDPKP